MSLAAEGLLTLNLGGARILCPHGAHWEVSRK